MGYFKNVTTDVIEDWVNGDTIAMIAGNHNLSLREVVEIINEYDGQLVDELKRALA